MSNKWKNIARVFALVGSLVTAGCATHSLTCDKNGCVSEHAERSLAGAENVITKDLPSDDQLPNGGLFVSYECDAGPLGKAKSIIMVDREGRKILTYTDKAGNVWDFQIKSEGSCGKIDIERFVFEALGLRPPPGLPGRRNWGGHTRKPSKSWRGHGGLQYNELFRFGP